MSNLANRKKILSSNVVCARPKRARREPQRATNYTMR